MAHRILINREEGEVRVAFLEGQDLAELHIEKSDEQTIVNNIYRGRVQDVVPGLQAAFVDVGLPRNMFLHFMDIRPESLVLGDRDQLASMRKASEKVMPGRIERKGRRPRQDPSAPQAAAPVKKGDQIIVQVLKDEIGGKAPRVTTNLSLAGRYLVMLPFPSQDGGVSRKIALGQDRSRLRKLLTDIKTDDYSFIVRTAGTDQPDESIRKDAESLERTWESILKRYRQINGPGLVNNDHDLIARLVRDAFPADFDEVICDDPDDVEETKFQVEEILPGTASKVKYYEGVDNIFARYGVDKQIEKSMARKYWLKSGGYLIIDENEALTAIDVNTGRFTGKKDQEKTSLKTNMEACEAIAEQIRLRDIGGIIVIDFIDMLSRANQERVSEEMRKALKDDRAKTAIGRIGDFGLMMLTRKRQRMSLLNQLNDECPYCTGTGWVLKIDETYRKMKYEILKHLGADRSISALLVSGHQRLIDALKSRYQPFLDELKEEWHCELVFRVDPDLHIEDFLLTPVKRPDRSGFRTGERIGDLSKLQPAIEDAVEGRREEKRPAKRVVEEPVKHVHERGRGKRHDDRRHPKHAPEEDDIEQPDEPRTEEDEVFERAMTVEGTQPASEASDGGRPRRRHRESSSERRERRRRAREQDQRPGGASEVPQPHQKQQRAGQQIPAIANNADFEEAPDAVPAAQGNQQGVAPGAPPRKKTRRGGRGGRNRRGRGGEKDVATQPGVPAEEPRPRPISTGPLRLAKSTKPQLDILGSVLDEIEQRLTSLPDEPAAVIDTGYPVKRPPQRKRRLRRAIRGSDGGFDAVAPPLDDDDEDLPLLVSGEGELKSPKKKPAKNLRRAPRPVAIETVPVESPVVVASDVKSKPRRKSAEGKPKPHARGVPPKKKRVPKLKPNDE